MTLFAYFEAFGPNPSDGRFDALSPSTDSSKVNCMKLPKRTTTYVGPLTDTTRWNYFRARTDDVFICTPPKCGTTWTQAICANLIFGRSDFEGKISDISPWVDSKIESSEICMGILESQAHRRFIKTHTPLDGIPYFDSSQYLIVYRDPRDAYFSVRNHLRNMLTPPDIPQLAEDPKKGFLAWVAASFEPGVGEQRSLEAFTRHFQSFWNYRHLENFHFFHYNDMKRDIRSTVSRIANILEIAVTEETLKEICEAVDFAEMKRNAGSFTPASGKPLFKSDEAFFSSGKNRQWRGVLSTYETATYTHRVNGLLPKTAVKWLANGNF